MKKNIVLTVVTLAAVGLGALLTGCKEDKSAGIPTGPKWKGPTYRLAFDTKAAAPAAKGVVIPPIKFTANPNALETRVVMVVRFDAPGAENKGLLANRMIAAPFDISGAEGALPADYIDSSSKRLAQYLQTYCIDGKVKIAVALARSSLNPQAEESEVENKLISDWLPTEVVVKKGPGKCTK